MKQEEVEFLRKLWAAPTGAWNVLDAMACLTSVVPMIPRLLDEREALLGALWPLFAVGACAEEKMGTTWVNLATKAIRLAES